MRALLEGVGWVNHPATKMWEGFEISLFHYQLEICTEWITVRRYKDTCLEKSLVLLHSAGLCYTEDYDSPVWLGNKEFHASHRSNLLRKNKEWYGKFGWEEPDNLPYIWPV